MVDPDFHHGNKILKNNPRLCFSDHILRTTVIKHAVMRPLMFLITWQSDQRGLGIKQVEYQMSIKYSWPKLRARIICILLQIGKVWFGHPEKLLNWSLLVRTGMRQQTSSVFLSLILQQNHKRIYIIVYWESHRWWYCHIIV